MMGQCLCKDGGSTGQDAEFTSLESRNNNNTTQCHNTDLETLELSEMMPVLAQPIIDALVLDTLKVIRTLVENDQEPPISMNLLHKIADREEGWLQLVQALVDVIPVDDPLGPAVMTLLLDDCPLPTIEATKRSLELIERLTGGDDEEENVSRHRNMVIVLGCVAEKMAGPRAVSLLTDSTLHYLLSNLAPDKHSRVTLFSLVALEKFAQTSENKINITKKLQNYSRDNHPLLVLQNKFLKSDDYGEREVGFCAQWCLDNIFMIESRQFSYQVTNTSHINMMLNSRDVSEYLKISPDGLQARCDAGSFESVRGTMSVDSGQWYYEVLMITSGVMQIGWATKESKFLNHEGYGIGDDEYSQAYDGCRQLMWFNAACHSQESLPRWKPGDVVGCFIDIDHKFITFSLNGVSLEPFSQVFQHSSCGFFPAASFMSFQQCEFNFGWRPFLHPPSSKFSVFNDQPGLSEEEKVILPRPLKMQAIRQLSVKENACSLCFDQPASVQLLPCQHNGFCDDCSQQLDTCPMCRTEIESCISSS